MRFVVLVAMRIDIMIFWEVIPCSLVISTKLTASHQTILWSSNVPSRVVLDLSFEILIMLYLAGFKFLTVVTVKSTMF
jgi:hypothetical protein